VSGLERIGAGVERELGRFPAAAGMAAIVAAWPGAVGAAIARNAWPARLARDGTLHVATSSSAWAFELTQLAGDVLTKLGEGLPPEYRPRALRYAPGTLPEATPEAAGESARRPPPADAESLAEGERVAAAVGDESLRSLIARAAAASLSQGASDRPL
jgi:hypothetical protein